MCIFDLEFLSNAVSLLLCLAVSDSLSLFLCQTITLTLSLPLSTPVLVCFCHNLLSELGTGSDVLHSFPVVNTQTPPPSPRLPCLWGHREVGVGGGGLSWLFRTSCTSSVLQLQASKFWGLGKGGRERGHQLPMLTSQAGRLCQETPDQWKLGVQATSN